MSLSRSLTHLLPSLRYAFLASAFAFLAAALALGCTTSSYSPAGSYSSPTGSNPSGGTDNEILVHGLPLGDPEVGHQVGNLVPDFTLALADGSTVTAAQLIGEGRPAFLFFFATT